MFQFPGQCLMFVDIIYARTLSISLSLKFPKKLFWLLSGAMDPWSKMIPRIKLSTRTRFVLHWALGHAVWSSLYREARGTYKSTRPDIFTPNPLWIYQAYISLILYWVFFLNNFSLYIKRFVCLFVCLIKTRKWVRQLSPNIQGSSRAAKTLS